MCYKAVSMSDAPNDRQGDAPNPPQPPNLPDVLRQLGSLNNLGDLKHLAGQIDPEQASAFLRNLVNRGVDNVWDEVAPGVARLGVVFVNVYAVDAGEGRWYLIDTGLPGFGGAVKAACERRFDGRPPEAIVLTHAHFDHAGNAESLASAWDVPVYAHRLELPYLCGESDYPPGDPTPGGAISFMSRAFPSRGYDLCGRVQVLALPEGEDEHAVPGLDGWTWHHTPGHTVGHISLFRREDALLIAGDAVATMDLDSWSEQVKRQPQVCRPAVPFTPDWPSAKASAETLASLEPRIVAAGHGLPVRGRNVASEMEHLAATLAPPAHGRYTHEPATYDTEGRVKTIPPPATDAIKPKLKFAAGVGLAGVALATFLALRGGRR